MTLSRREFTRGGALAAASLSVPGIAKAGGHLSVYEMTAAPILNLVVNGSTYHTPAAPYTAHTVTLPANQNLNFAKNVIWRLLWTAPAPVPPYETGIIRLFSRTPDASAPKVPLAYISSSTMINPGANNISNDAVDVTAAFNAFINIGAYGHIGWDVAGDNSTPLTFFKSTLEVVWDDN